MESVGTLAAGVAHDLNNILTPMLMATGILEGKLVEKEDRELLSLLEGGAKRGAAIVRQLLTFSREFAESRVPVNVMQLIRELQVGMRPTLPPNIKVVIQLPADLWWVTADPIQLPQVMMNLCHNARDAMPSGGTLTLSAENVQLPGGGSKYDPWGKGGRYVKIVVTDTGVGIPPENLGRIFDPFFTTKEAGKGAGLGLSTVYGIVKGHGGSVTVDSQPNHGASFKIVLPASVPLAEDGRGIDASVRGGSRPAVGTGSRPAVGSGTMPAI
jgi:signal transduction histidine kinase